MSERYRKNIEKVSSMVDGDYKEKIQSGYTPTEEKHEIGDIWTDSDDKKWEQKNGYRVNITKLANAGIAEQCSDCEKYIVKKWDKDVYFWNGRCYYCQIDFEAELKGTKKFDKWSKNQDKRIKEQYIEKFEKENKEIVKEIEKMRKEGKPFGLEVANAMANSNVEMTIKKNQS